MGAANASDLDCAVPEKKGGGTCRSAPPDWLIYLVAKTDAQGPGGGNLLAVHRHGLELAGHLA